MLSVRLITDPFDLAAYTEHRPAALIPFLTEHFGAWPETARLYKDTIAQANDVTPATEDDIASLEDDGVYYVVVYPGDPVTAIIVGVVAVLALAAAFYLLMPKIPTASADVQSSNNALGERTNKARPNARIEDIFGSVLSIPTMLTVPLLTFEDNVEVEVAYLCIGRGSYLVEDIRDGSTPIGLMAGAGAEVYAPGTSPNFGAPQVTAGTAVDAPFRDVYRLNEVNGQTLDPPDANRVSGSGNIRFVAPNFIENNGGIDFTEFFGAGDDLTVSGANFGSGSASILDATTQLMRFHADKSIEFFDFDPSTLFSAGQTIILTNATYAGQDDVTGDTIYVDVSGTYVVDTVTATTITLV